MKKRCTALLLMLAILIIPAAAASTYRKQIAVDYGITLNINGQKAVLKDPNGNIVQPFVYSGTTYVPIRAVSENLGATVGYDSSTNTAIVKGSVNSTNISNDLKEYVYFLFAVERASNNIYQTVKTYYAYGVDGNFSYNIYTDIGLDESSVNLVNTALGKVSSSNPYLSDIGTIFTQFCKLNDETINCVVAYTNKDRNALINAHQSAALEFLNLIPMIARGFGSICS